KFKKYPCNLGQVNALWENPKSPGTLWVGTSTEGLFTFDMKSGIFYEKANTKTARSRLTDNFVRALCQDSQGRLWIGTRGGIEIFDEASGHFSICQHEAGDNNSLSQNSVHTIFRDAKGSVWVGTYFGGANVVYAHASDFKTYANNNVHSSISSDVITSIVEDASHNLWIGTDGGGLNYFDRTGDKFISYEHNESDRGSIGSSLVKVVLIDTDGNVWAGTHGGGLNVLESHRFKKYLYKENEQLKETTEVESILEDKSGRFWVGSEDGLNVFIRKGRELLPYFGPLNIKNTQHLRSIHLLFEDSKSNIWMVASGILYFLKAGEKNFSSWTPLSDSHITSKVNCIR
ncbi:MAG TPA: two-component regulator propeller domain-containing protein, partial [Bdellovibrio sp.]|nr:two-component regulator propeller domain-containing protein [Bdellovibrio sp.]